MKGFTCAMKYFNKILPIAICSGLFLPAYRLFSAEGAGTRPVKDRKEANQLIHWPKNFDPKETDAFVHNEIWIKAPAEVIWDNLVRATEWPTWYSNSADIQ